MHPSALIVLLALGLQTPAPPAATPPATRESPAGGAATGILFKSITVDDETYTYCVYVPFEYTSERAWPTILFLCGSGDAGNDGLRTIDSGIGRILRRDRKRIPAIVVFPQCRQNQTWVGAAQTLAVRCLEENSREYHVDHDRVYLTGLSLGGQGAWLLAARYPRHFAAVVPICGFIDGLNQPADADRLKQVATNLKDVPIWAFHGAADRNVPVGRTREVIAALKAAGNTTTRYTEYPDLTHNCWDRAYGEAELWKWLLAQKRRSE